MPLRQKMKTRTLSAHVLATLFLIISLERCLTTTALLRARTGPPTWALNGAPKGDPRESHLQAFTNVGSSTRLAVCGEDRWSVCLKRAPPCFVDKCLRGLVNAGETPHDAHAAAAASGDSAAVAKTHRCRPTHVAFQRCRYPAVCRCTKRSSSSRCSCSSISNSAESSVDSSRKDKKIKKSTCDKRRGSIRGLGVSASACICEAAAAAATASGCAYPPGPPLVLRFAPSPTGLLHVGGARTALFNYGLLQDHRLHKGATGGSPGNRALQGRGEGGRDKGDRFILRIDDTDASRSQRQMEAALIEDLQWLGIKWEEGPDVGGSRGPYRQSERLEIYQQQGRRLLDKGLLYKCFCSRERLLQLRRECTQHGLPPRYDGKCRSLDPQQAELFAAAGRPFTLRFKTPAEPEAVCFTDLVRGFVRLSVQQTAGDFVCFRDAAGAPSLGVAGAAGSREEAVEGPSATKEGAVWGIPVYNFCAAVDDWLMGVTAVVRGEEHIPNTVAQILVARALGAPVPLFCHLPVIVAKEGGKISKRRQQQPAISSTNSSNRSSSSSSSDYTIRGMRLRGYHPEAVVDFLRGHHTNDGGKQSDRPSWLSAVGKSAFCFDDVHLKFAHKQKIRQLAASPNAEPLVHFFLQIIAMASDGCPGAAVSLQHAAAAPALQSIQREAPVSSDIHGCSQHLFDFISLAARLVLPQHIVPAAVVAALGEYLTGGPLQVVDALGDHQGLAAVYGGLAAFRGVAAAVLKSRELFAGLSTVCTGPEECAGDGYERIQHHPEQHLDIMQQFEIWKQQLLLQLQISKAELLRLLRISLTGKDTGLPLLQQLQLLKRAELAGLPPLPAAASCSSEGDRQGDKMRDRQEDNSSRTGSDTQRNSTPQSNSCGHRHRGVLWISRQKVKTLQQRLDELQHVLKELSVHAKPTINANA